MVDDAALTIEVADCLGYGRDSSCWTGKQIVDIAKVMGCHGNPPRSEQEIRRLALWEQAVELGQHFPAVRAAAIMEFATHWITFIERVSDLHRKRSEA